MKLTNTFCLVETSGLFDLLFGPQGKVECTDSELPYISRRRTNVVDETSPVGIAGSNPGLFERCPTTVLSNFEAGSNYKDTKDPALYVTFPLVDDPNTNLIAWTTTPWTLPSNLACAVNAEFDYLKI